MLNNFLRILVITTITTSWSFASFTEHLNCSVYLLATKLNPGRMIVPQMAVKHLDGVKVTPLGRGRFGRVEKVKSPEAQYAVKTYSLPSRRDLDYERTKSLLPFSNKETVVILDVAKIERIQLAREFKEGEEVYKHWKDPAVLESYKTKVTEFIKSLGVTDYSTITAYEWLRNYYKDSRAWSFPAYSFYFKDREMLLKADNLIIGKDGTLYLIDPY